MFLVTIDKSKRLLLLSYIGLVRADELKRALAEGPALLADMPPCLRVLADFERMESMEPAGVVEIGKLMEMCDEKGVEIVVRVIPDASKDIGLNILAAFHYRNPIQAITCRNIQEGMAALGL